MHRSGLFRDLDAPPCDGTAWQQENCTSSRASDFASDSEVLNELEIDGSEGSHKLTLEYHKQ
jgi:hypothetical protein